MRITAPVSLAEEVEILLGSGAGEIYCGVVPQRWAQLFDRALWINRRDPRGGNLASEEDLLRAAGAAHRLGAPLFLTLNAPYFTDLQQELVLELAEWAAAEAGVDALIVADLGLLRALVRRLSGRIAFHVSTLAGAGNREAVAHWADLGAQRVILPRHLTLAEIGRLAEETAGRVELEAFVLNDTCVYEEGFCQTVHGVPGLGAFCMTPWEYRIRGAGGAEAAAIDEEAWARHLEDYRRWLWYCNSCGCTLSEKGLPLGSCGLCALPALARAGIAAVKVVGREASTLRKLRSVQLVRRVLERVEAGEGEAAAAAWARRIRETPDLCASGYMCYYRETAPGEEGSACLSCGAGRARGREGRRGGRVEDGTA